MHSEAVVNEQSLPQIVGVLLASIRDLPLIAEKVCYALAQLAAGFKDSDQTSLLSPYFKDIVGALLDAVRCQPSPNLIHAQPSHDNLEICNAAGSLYDLTSTTGEWAAACHMLTAQISLVLEESNGNMYWICRDQSSLRQQDFLDDFMMVFCGMHAGPEAGGGAGGGAAAGAGV